MQLKANALVRAKCSGLDGNIVADSREINVGLPVKDDSQGTIPGVFLLSINAGLHILELLRHKPRKTTALDIRFEPAVPQYRALWIWQIIQARKKDGLIPNPAGLRDAFFHH